MKFQTEDENDIAWMRNPSEYEAGPTIQRIKDAGQWDHFLNLHANEDGVIDCDGLYDYLRHESGDSLLDVGLHDNEGTATVREVIEAWLEANKDDGYTASYCADGTTFSGVSLFTYRNGDTQLEFEATDAHGAVEEISLDEDEVLELVGDKANNNATTGKWDSHDEATATFEMWRGRD